MHPLDSPGSNRDSNRAARRGGRGAAPPSTPRTPSRIASLRLAFAALVSFASFGALTGCARGESAEERQLAQLRDEVARVQADHDRFDQRIGALEVQADGDRPERAASTGSAAKDAGRRPPPTPELRVVRLAPADDRAGDDAPIDPRGDGAGAAPGSDDPNDATPRPVIQVQGRAGPREASSAPRGPRPSALDPAARRAYKSALALVNARKYPEALDALAGFLVQWPDHPNADNAMYWRGECYFAQGDFERAAEQFEGTIARFPLGNKAPDALLKLGLSAARLGQADKAKASFDRLEREFPRSDATRRIPPAGAPSRAAPPPGDPRAAPAASRSQ